MHRILFLLLVLSISLRATELSAELPSSDSEEMTPQIWESVAEPPAAEAAEPATTWSALPLLPKINLINGCYIDEACDLIVAGAEPLSITRFYSHLSSENKEAGSWLFNPESYAVANFEYTGLKLFVAAGEKSGAIHKYENKKEQSFHFNPLSKEYLGAGGQTHPLNTHIDYHKEWGKRSNKLKERPFSWVGEIRDGAGTIRSFSTPSHFWLREIRYDKHNKAAPSTWTPYRLPISEEKKASGNRIVYTPEAISAYNSANQLIGQIKIHSQGDTLTLLGSDGRKATYTFVNHKITSVEASGKIPLKYHYNDQGYLHKVEYPDGRGFVTEYDPKTHKVTAQFDGEGHLIARFAYEKACTALYDAENNKTLFHYDENKRITTIEKYRGDTLFSSENYCWDVPTGNLLTHKLGDLKTVEYRYDKNHNVIEERISGEGGSAALYRTYSDDGFNLKLSESDGTGKVTRFIYKPATNLLTKELVYEGPTIRRRTFFTYDESAICIEKIEDDGLSEEPDDLTSVTFRKIITLHPKHTFPCYGLPETLEEKTLDAQGHEILLYAKQFTYHPSGKLAKETISYPAQDRQSSHTITAYEYDSEERRVVKKIDDHITTQYEYDKNHNLLSRSGPRADMKKRWSYDLTNRPIQEDESGLITQKIYDKLGRVSDQLDPLGHITHYSYDILGRVTEILYPDGSRISREYDLLGNPIHEIDPNGYETFISYNFRGAPTLIHHPDGSSESYTYHPDGTLSTHRNRQSATTHFIYDIFQHPIKVEVYDTQGNCLKTTSATYSPFFLLSTTDGEGETTLYRYDFAGRKISEELRARKITYDYDGIGHVIHTQRGHILSTYRYNSLGYLIEKEVEDTRYKGNPLRRESYGYDEAGNRIEVTNSKGTTTTLFDGHGQLVEIKNPDGTSTHISHAYTDHYTKTLIDPMEVKTTLIYDWRGREVKKTLQNSDHQVIELQTKSYDPSSNLTQLQEEVYEGTHYLYTLTHKWTYGPLGRVEKVVEGDTKTTRYTYQDGTFHSTIKPDGTELFPEYDGLGQLSRLHSSRGDIDYRYNYDKNGQLLMVYDAFSKMTTTRSYDSYGHLCEEVLANKNVLKKITNPYGQRESTLLPDGTAIHYSYRGEDLLQVSRGHNHFTYRHRDLEGLPTEIVYPIGILAIKRDTSSNIRHYQFSDLNRNPYYTMTQLEYDKNQNLTHALSTDELHFSYDDLGQLIAENGRSYASDSLHNRLSQKSLSSCQLPPPYLYDPNGNLLSDGERNYTYDSLGRLTTLSQGINRVEYTYDAFDRRLTKTIYRKNRFLSELSYLWDEDSEIGATQASKIVELRIVGENDLLYELYGKSYFPILDPFGNVVALTGEWDKNPIETYSYTAFGEPLTQGTFSPWRFCSKRMDSESGLVYFGKRYYSPLLGRWLTPDPAGMFDSLNPYAYVHNNPLKYQDPDGEFGFLSSLVGAIIGGISSGIHGHWKLSAILKGFAIGAASGFFGDLTGAWGYSIAGNHGVASLLSGGIFGGAGGGAMGGGLSAAAFGGDVWQGIGYGALQGALSGGSSSMFMAFNVPEAFAITGGGALSSYALEGGKAVRDGALYSFGGAVLHNGFTMFGLGAEAVVPKQDSPEWREMNKTDDTYLTTPALNFSEEYNPNNSFGKNVCGYAGPFLIALLGNGYSHVWHSKDYNHSIEEGKNEGYVPSGHHYKQITSGVPYTGQNYALKDFKNYSLLHNSCCSRYGYLYPARYYADYHYPDRGNYWWRRRR